MKQVSAEAREKHLNGRLRHIVKHGYGTGDLSYYSDEHCACGRTSN